MLRTVVSKAKTERFEMHEVYLFDACLEALQNRTELFMSAAALLKIKSLFLENRVDGIGSYARFKSSRFFDVCA